MEIISEEEAYKFIRSSINNANASFNEIDIKEALKAVNKYFDNKYDTNAKDIDVVGDFERIKDKRITEATFFSRDDAIFSMAYEDILANPEKAVSLFLNAKNKKQFLSIESLTHNYDREDCYNQLIRILFQSLCERFSINEVEKAATERKVNFLTDFKKNIEFIYENYQDSSKEKLIKNISFYADFLESLVSLDDMFDRQNDLYARTRLSTLKGNEYSTSGLMMLGLSDEEKEKAYSEEGLKDCNLMQLEAILSFLINRSEKVFERIGTGMYIYYVNSIETADEENVKNIQFLKKVWQKKQFFTDFSRDFIDKHADEFIDQEGENGSSYGMIEQSKVYQYLRNYRKAYLKFFPGADIAADYERFDTILGGGIANRYLGKDKLIESLIIYSDQTKSNWGYTKEECKKTKDMILLCFDVPGLNMPIRLHADKEKVKHLMTKYMKTSEIPVYCGDDDFTVHGNKVGTQALYYVPKNKINGFKSVVNKGKVSPGYKDMAEHIKLLQLDNSRKRILKWKLNREIPDYYDIVKDEIIESEVPKECRAVDLSSISKSSKKVKKSKKK